MIDALETEEEFYKYFYTKILCLHDPDMYRQKIKDFKPFNIKEKI